jgi:hypothetical protein
MQMGQGRLADFYSVFEQWTCYNPAQHKAGGAWNRLCLLKEEPMSTEKYTRKISEVIPLDDDWGKVLQKLVLEAADDLARHPRARGNRSDQETIEIKIPVTISFDLAILADGGVADAGVPCCVCVFKQDPDGSSVCICKGPCAADCDCDTPSGPIVASA